MYYHQIVFFKLLITFERETLNFSVCLLRHIPEDVLYNIPSPPLTDRLPVIQTIFEFSINTIQFILS